ncbi:MAG: hypothetical protein ACRD88_18465 [Terriglobia bacterium]
MKALFVMAALACWIGLGPLAQAQAAQAPAEHSMTGCLRAADAGKFRLTDLAQGPMTVEIAETTANLTPHVGHKIEITGSRIAGAPGHTMKVTAMKMVAAACP